MNNAYWIVVGLTPSSKPFEHGSQESADTEAIRLATLHPGLAFTVFKAERKFIKSDVTRIELDGGMPF